MAGSAADTPAASTGPQFVRVSDADRDDAIDELKREFVDGRLSHDTFMLRMQSALGARHQSDLAGLFSDLPARRGRLASMREALRGWQHRAGEMLDDVTRYPRDVPRDHAARVQVPEPAPPQPPVPVATALPPAPLYFPPGTETSFTIGRDQRCDLHIADLTVSRLHARLTRDADEWLLTDLGSTNGTRINGWRVRAPVPVRPGDQVRFGSVSFVIQPDAGAPSG
ncbi:MAG TPA: DUF1707 and FHA domain-containing protein [Streptosporangiaceae bacterium]|nr:DUF1707 and FHA domain-containing protein [Streptosporangiaceae bacterium]